MYRSKAEPVPLDVPSLPLVPASILTLGEPDIDLTRSFESTIESKTNRWMVPHTAAGYRVSLNTNGLDGDSSLIREHDSIYIYIRRSECRENSLPRGSGHFRSLLGR